MPSLGSLVSTHRTVLLIDSASVRIHVGLWRRDCEVIWRQSDQEAGIAVFACADAVLAQARIGVADLDALIFCEGPGSILGIRTAAMALRAWPAAEGRALPAFAYRSLELLASDLQTSGTPAPFAVVADARRGFWHWVDGAAGGPVGPLRRVTEEELLAFTGGVFTPDGFRAWTRLLRPISTVAYDLPVLWLRQRETDLLHAAPEPDAFLHEDAAYATWTPQIHRAGVSPSRTRAGS
jgi:tRNA threonylcarbamoyladenosine biosynthesis protein TsaB